MGRKNGWLSKVKKALNPNSKEKNAEKTNNSKKKWLENENPSVTETPDPVPEVSYPSFVPPLEDFKGIEVENGQTSHAYTVAVATAVAAEAAAAAAAQAAAMASRIAIFAQFSGKSKAEVAAIRIQTAFRGYLARRAFRALRGLVRLKTLVDGPIVKRQTSNTLKSMQALFHVQSQIQSRRMRMLEENRALQRQLLQKRAKDLESLRIGEEWDDSLQSKEKIDENLLHKYEAAMRRERALAYSYTHQQTWKKSTKQANLLFMDPTNPQWGWSWLERWMATETTKATADKDQDSSKSRSGGEITRAFARYSEKNPPSPATPTSKTVAGAGRKLKSASPKQGPKVQDDDSRSAFSVQSNRNRRHSIAGSSVGDDESFASSPCVPSYMAPTHSAKAKLKLPSPSGADSGLPSSAASAKKRLSFPPSPGPVPGRRLSAPPRKLDAESLAAN